MGDLAALYRELKPELASLAQPLFAFASDQVIRRGEFLPFGATLGADGQVALHAAATEHEYASGEEILPLLVAGVSDASSSDDVCAAAVCEWVKIGVDGGALQDAIKVHVHHRRGLATAFYMPARKSLLRRWRFDEVMIRPAPELIEGWPNMDAA